jgi:hypothetical protein
VPAPVLGIQVNHRLQIGGEPVPIESATVHLELNTVGWGVFAVSRSAAVAKGRFAEYFISVAGGAHYLVFTGAVVEVTDVGAGRQVKVRELSMVLEYPTSFFLPRATPRLVIGKIQQETRLHFILPANAPYLDERRPSFSCDGNCERALAHMSRVWDLPDVVWYQLPDGTMFWGRWRSGPFTKAAVPIESKLAIETNLSQSLLRLPCIPALRPGMIVQSDFSYRINATTFQGDTVLVHFSKL